MPAGGRRLSGNGAVEEGEDVFRSPCRLNQRNIFRIGGQPFYDNSLRRRHLYRVFNWPLRLLLEASRASVPELQRAIGGIDDGRRVPRTFFASDANRGGVNVGKTPDCREWQDAHAIVLSP